MHKSFLPLFCVSLIGVLLSSFVTHGESSWHWTGLIAGVIPLAVYHIILSRGSLLNQAEIDSIYYFGFLVTVVTLVSTAISIGLADQLPKIQWILLQFGLGLIATGYALFARISLMTKSSSLVEMDVVESTKKLVGSISEVSGEFDRAGHEVTAFVELLNERLDRLVKNQEERLLQSVEFAIEAHRKSVNELVNNSLEKCTLSIDSATTKFSNSISLVIEEVGRIQAEAQAISFDAAGEKLIEFSDQVEKTLESVINKTAQVGSDASNAINELTTTTRKVQKLASDISGKLNKISELENTLQAFESINNAINQFGNSIAFGSKEVENLGIKANETTDKISSKIVNPIDRIELAIKKIVDDLPLSSSELLKEINKLKVAATELNNSMNNNIAGLNKAGDAFKLISEFSRDISGLGDKAKLTATEMAQLLGVVAKLRDSMGDVSHKMNLAGASAFDANGNEVR